MHFERTKTSNHNVCFVLEPYPYIKELDLEQRSQRKWESDLVFDEIIEPAVSAHNFRLVRSTELCQPGYVTREHQRLAEEEALVIANLTYYDPVVFYCLAWRLAKNPKANLLVVLRHDQDRLIETPVLNVPPVLYDLSTTDAKSENDKTEQLRRKVQLARRDLTRMVQHLVELNTRSGPPPYVAESPPVTPPQPAPQPDIPVNGTSQVVDEIMRHLLRRVENAGSGDIVERLSASLMKSSF